MNPNQPRISMITTAPYVDEKDQDNVALFALDETGRVWRMVNALGEINADQDSGERLRWTYLPMTPTSKPFNRPQPAEGAHTGVVETQPYVKGQPTFRRPMS